jgi:Flp pilus assembly protein TadG
MPVLLAGMLIVLLGMTGLAIDFGFGTLERRTLQNGADAASLTGATDLASLSSTDATVRAKGANLVADVQTMVTVNGAAATTSVVCELVDNTNAVTGSCSNPPSNSTSGVKVTATNVRDTFFMRVLGVPTMTISAQSISRVSAWASESSNPANNSGYDVWGSFFIVCGYDTMEAPNAANGNRYTPYSILSGTPESAEPQAVNAGAYGRTFVIHEPNPNRLANCGISDGEFKGLNSSSGLVRLPTWLYDESGNRAGPVSQAVKTYGGCKGLTSDSDPDLDNCIMIIPIFTKVNVKSRGDWDMRAVRFLPFRIIRRDANTHWGTLIDNVALQTDTATMMAPWTKNTQRTMTVVRTVN